MTSIEKLLKAFEAVKLLQTDRPKEEHSEATGKDRVGPTRTSSEIQSSIVALASGLSQQGQQLLSRKEPTVTSKDKIVLCTSLVHQVLSGNKTGPEVQKVLALGIESLLLLLDDPDPDVRSNADDSLNKMIRGMTESYSGKILLELFKEIKKNGNIRSLRGAISRFAAICHHIRPQKCRAYIQNLMSPLTKIAKRPEEQLLETLAQALEKILPVLGHFTNDNEIRTLMRSFLPSISNESPSVRRSAASSLILLCRHSRKPHFLFLWLLDNVLQAIIPIQQDTPRAQILGGLLLIRSLIPQFPQLSLQTTELPLSHARFTWPRPVDMVMSQDQTLQVYELCLHCCRSSDQNIVTTSLETLQALLQNISTNFFFCLVSEQGIGRSRIVDEKPHKSWSRASSEVSIVPVLVEDESTLETTGLDLNVEESFVESSVSVTFDQNEEETLPELTKTSPEDTTDHCSREMSYSGIEIGNLADESLLLGRSDVKLDEDADATLDKPEDSSSESDMFEEPVQKQDISSKGNIGTYTDSDVPLKYLIRFLCSSFLLYGKPGVLLSDQEVKVSRKALALSCLSYALCLQPALIKETLHIVDKDVDENEIQLIEDIILYQNHPDPQLKANTASIIGNFIASSYITNSESFNSFGNLSLEALLDSLCRLLSCKSSVTVRNALLALKTCLPEVLQSPQAGFAMPVIPHIFRATANSYWLVKVDLCDLVSEVSVKMISHMEASEASLRQNTNSSDVSSRFSYRVVDQIFSVLASDHDGRVRSACAKAIVKSIPELMLSGDIVMQSSSKYINPEIAQKSNVFQTEDLQWDSFTYEIPFHRTPSDDKELLSSLSKTIHVFSSKLFLDSDRFSRLGCLEILSVLCDNYSPSRFYEAWLPHISGKPRKNAPCHYGLITLALSLSSESFLNGNLVAQQYCLNIAVNCLAGLAAKAMELDDDSEKFVQEQKQWSCFGRFESGPVADRVVKHSMRILNIYSHVVEDVVPGSKPIFPLVATGSSMSPIKMKSKGDKEKISSSKSSKSDEDKEKNTRSNVCGIFFHLPEYIRIYDTVKSVHQNYMMSLEASAKSRLCGLLETCLSSLSSLLQMASSKEIAGIAAELLHYLKTLSALIPAETIYCGRQLLRCLFVSKEQTPCSPCKPLPESAVTDSMCSSMITSITLQESSLDATSLYSNVFKAPMVALKKDVLEIMEGKMDLDRRGVQQQSSTTLKSSRAKLTDKMTLSYIRLFEPLVIKALKIYTISNDVYLQKSVLDLLVNLVQIPVNYCLLDSEQIFIGYVIRQFELIEEGQMQHAGVLIPSMFSFLVFLSYERNHSKSIIGVPKIIQLCDGLMASDQPPLSHCILALDPLVKDLFLKRGNNPLVDQGELETQKEVLSSMLIRLAQYYQALHLLSVVLVSTHKSDKERWRKLSQQILDVIIPGISKLEININSKKALYAVEEVLNNVCPSVFRPPDALLNAMLASPNEIETTEGVERWVGGVVILFRVLVSRTPVDLVLGRLQQLGLTMEYVRSEPSSLSSSIYQTMSPKRTAASSVPPDAQAFRDPLNVSKSAMPPHVLLARFLLEVVRVSVLELRTIQLSRVHTKILGDTSLQSDPTFLSHLTRELLMIILHLVETGHWEIFIQALKELCHSDTELCDEIGDTITDIANAHPYLSLLWCKLMTDLDFASQALWSKILGSSQRKSVSTPSSEPSFIGESYIPNCLPLEFVRKSGLLILSEFVIRHMQEGEWLTWLVVQHINDVVRLCKEPPVLNLLKEIYASSAASALLIQAVHARIEGFHMDVYGREIVSLVSGVHVKQSGPLIVFLVEKLLPSPLLLVSRLAASLCSQRLFVLLAATSETSHFLPQDIKKIISVVRDNSIHKRYIQICGLLQQLIDNEEKKYIVVPPTKDVVSSSPTLSSLNADWFLQLTRNRCLIQEGGGNECSQLLSNLEYNDVLSVMSSKHFNKRLLASTIRHGLMLTLQANVAWSDSSSVDQLDNEDSSAKSRVEAPLYAVSKIVLFQHLQKIVLSLPKQHMIYNPGGGNKYSERLSKLFANEIFSNISLEATSAAVLEYINSFESLLWKTEISSEEAEVVIMFAAVSLEYLHWQSWLGRRSISTIHLVMNCVNNILMNTSLFAHLNTTERTSMVCSMTSCVHVMSSCLYKPNSLPNLPVRLNQALVTTGLPAASAAQKLMQLVLWLEQQGHHSLPVSISVHIRGLITALGRTNMLNGIVRVPPEMWSLGWDPDLSTDGGISVPPLPSSYFQETDVLKQFIFRMNLFGFLERHQFEETWMVFLSALNVTPTDETPPQEVSYLNQCLSLAVRGTTSLLVQTLLMPNPGNPHSSSLLNIPRDKPPSYLTTKAGQKLQNVMQQLHLRLKQVQHLIRGPAKAQQNYHAGQVSVEYLSAAVVSTHPVDDSPQHFISITGCYEFEIREKQLNSCGLDVQSCLHFLHYLYSSWLQNDMCSSVVAEVVKSVSVLCDLFTSAAHHRWVLEILVPLYTSHPVEDYITGQYVIIATSKALATLKLAQQNVRLSLIEGVFHIVESGLRHSQVSVRTCSLQGLLYLLQAGLDENSSLIQIATSYIHKHTEGKNFECEDHSYVVWDLCVYLVEHYPNLPDTTLPSTALHMALSTAASQATSPRILNKTLKGVERLVLVQHLPPNTVEVVLKLVMDLVLNSPPSVALASLPLFITALYVSTTREELPHTPVDMMESDPELLLQLMEKVSILFDKIRGGYPYEAEVLSGLLATCLLDILPASQILNKVITEYISSHQPHPHLLAGTLFQVFKGAVNEGGNSIVQEWVLLSLSNFTQRVPVTLAVWCLTCFFIAASSDTWLRFAFPSVQARLGKLETRDVHIFCLAATHFRQSLPTADQKTKFDKAFQAVAIPGSPFEKLLMCIGTLEKSQP